jgi:hypothetical protein
MIRAAQSTVNKLVRSGASAARRQVRMVYNIKNKDLKGLYKIQSSGKGANDILARFISKGYQLPLIMFIKKQDISGVDVEIKKGERTSLPHAFLARWKRKNWRPGRFSLHIWERLSKKRLPIHRLFGVSFADMVEDAGEGAFQKTIADDAGKTFNHELDYFLSKMGK